MELVYELVKSPSLVFKFTDGLKLTGGFSSLLLSSVSQNVCHIPQYQVEKVVAPKTPPSPP